MMLRGSSERLLRYQDETIGARRYATSRSRSSDLLERAGGKKFAIERGNTRVLLNYRSSDYSRNHVVIAFLRKNPPLELLTEDSTIPAKPSRNEVTTANHDSIEGNRERYFFLAAANMVAVFAFRAKPRIFEPLSSPRRGSGVPASCVARPNGISRFYARLRNRGRYASKSE